MLGTGADGRPIALEGRQLAAFAGPVSLIVALFVGWIGAANWLRWLTFFHGVPFGTTDPHLRARRRVLRLQPADLPDRPAAGAARHGDRARRAALLYYVFSGSFVVESRPGVSSWPRIRLDPGRAPASVAARGARPRPAGVGRVARDSKHAADAGDVERRVRCVVHRRLRDNSVPLGDRGDARRRAPRWRSGTGFGRLGWPLAARPGRSTSRSPSSAACTQGSSSGSLVTPNEQNRSSRSSCTTSTARGAPTRSISVEERELSGDAELTPARHHRERRHDRERAAVGSPAAPPDVRARSRRFGPTTTS